MYHSGSWFGSAFSLLALLSQAPVAYAQSIDSVITEQATSGGGLGLQPVVSIDDEGNRYVFASFEGSVPFGEGDASQTLEGTHSDLFVAKYGADGELSWVREFETSPGAAFPSAAAGGIDYDGSGGIFVAGSFVGRLNVGSRQLATSSSGTNSFVARLDAESGDVEWVNQISATSVNLVRDLDADSNVAITGRFSGTTAFEGQFGSTTTLSSFTPNGNDMFVALYDPAGQVIFVRQAGDDGAEGLGVHMNVTSVQVVGNFHGAVRFDGGDADPVERVSRGSTDGFLARYHRDGDLRAVQTIAGPDSSSALNVVAFRTVTVYLTGHFRDRVSVGTTLLTSRGDTDAYVARYDVIADRIDSVVQIGGAGRDILRGLDVDGDRNVHITGSFASPSLSIGSGATAITLPRQPSGRQTAFLASLAPDGVPRSGQTVLGDFEPNRIAADPELNLHVAGSHQRELTFGAGDDLLVVPAPAQGRGLVLTRFLPEL